MPQPAETTPNLALKIPESSKETENAANRTEDSTSQSSRDSEQPKADVRGSTIEDPSQNNPPWNVPIHTEPPVSVKKGMLCEKLQSLLIHGTLPSSGLTPSRTEIGVSKGFTAGEPPFQNFELYIDR
jgi:hypothetical protein